MASGIAQSVTRKNIMERSEWLLARTQGVGSSDSPVVMGLSPWKIPLQVYLEKVGELIPEKMSQAQRAGLLLEDVVAKMYEEETGNLTHKPEKVISVSETHPWLIASLDRIAITKDSRARILELKTSRSDDGWGAPGSEDIPPCYYCQVQHQMLVTGYKWADVAVLIAGQDLKVYSIQSNADYQEKMLDIISKFWRMVQDRTPPPLDWSHPRTASVVNKTANFSESKEIYLDSHDEYMLVSKFCEIREEIKMLQDKKELLQAQIIHAMGDAQIASTRQGHKITRRVVNRSGYSVGPTFYTTFEVRT